MASIEWKGKARTKYLKGSGVAENLREINIASLMCNIIGYNFKVLLQHCLNILALVFKVC